MTHTFKTTLALTLLLSAFAPTVAMNNDSFGGVPFGEAPAKEALDYKAQIDERVQKFRASRESQLVVETPADNLAVQIIDEIIEDQAPRMNPALMAELKAAVQEELGNDEPVEVMNVGYRQQEVVEIDPDITEDVEEQDRLNAQSDEEVEPLLAIENKAEAAEQQGAPSALQQEVPAVQAAAVEGAPAQAAKFYTPALNKIKEVQGLFRLDYLKKGDVRDMSMANLSEHKAKIAATFALCAVVVSAVGGIVFGITKLFKKGKAVKAKKGADSEGVAVKGASRRRVA